LGCGAQTSLVLQGTGLMAVPPHATTFVVHCGGGMLGAC
jgi:hypothetical protein